MRTYEKKEGKFMRRKAIASILLSATMLSSCANGQPIKAEQKQDTQIHTVVASLQLYNDVEKSGNLLDENGEVWHFDSLYLPDTDYIITYGENFDLLSLQYNNIIVYFTK